MQLLFKPSIRSEEEEEEEELEVSIGEWSFESSGALRFNGNLQPRYEFRKEETWEGGWKVRGGEGGR